ncbi:hypothetical protein Tco_1017071 [Tanacetum coccineum]|uniref:Xylulose kinase-1 n=1 Tax=Tanacetum coccineum TaxID=301880 RepID=A0ABQ5FQF5_9ASTR
MTTLQFADTHNLVAFLDKPTESEGFEQIVDFLNASSIKYALTVNPTIYTSCIQQFWSTVKAKTVNGEVQLQALVDGKKIVVTEASVRRDLQLEDADGVDCLPNAIIFEHLTLMGYEKLSQKLTFYKAFFSPQWKFLIHTILQCLSAKTTAWNEFSSTMASAIIYEPVTEEPSMQLKELIDFCTKLQQRVLDLENTKTAQAQEITSLKRRVKRLEKKGGSRTHKLKRLRRVGRSARIVSSEEASLGDQEDASKQERKIDDIDADAEITLVDETQGRHNDDLMFDMGVLNDEEVFAGQPTTKGVVMQELSESITTTTPITSSKDKGKGIMVEEPLKMKKKDQVLFDEQEAIRLQAQFDKEERIAREKDEVNAALIAQWNDIQDKVETGYELAQRLQAEEQEELTIEEKSKLIQQLLEKRRKHFAAKRAEERRNRPPTKAQQRSIMCTYLKNMAGWKPKDLKTKSFANVQELFDKAMKRVNTFVDMDTELVGGSEVREEGSETREESSSKRAGDELEQEPSKKQKMEDDKETTELQSMMEVIPDEEEVAVDAIPLATKPPSIVDWKIIKEGKIGYYQIIRADGNSKRYSSMIQMLKSFDREDLETLWKLVKAKHGYTRPEEGVREYYGVI